MLKTKPKYSVMALMIIAFMFTGCVAEEMKNIKQENNTVAPPTLVKQKPVTGSIWAGESTNSLICSDKKARYINDIVTIVISETVSGGNKASTNTSRDTSNSHELSALLGIETSILESNPNMGSTISLGGTSSNSHKGSGDTSRSSSLEASISARVLKVLDNGNLFIEGKRQLTVNAEDQYIIISGIVRPDDITSENTINSEYIADARIIYTGSGIINDKMRPGWLTRVADWVWPF